MKKVIYLLLLMLLSASSIFAQAPFTLKISGELSAPAELTLQTIASMPHTTAILKGKDGSSRTYSGVPLLTILTSAGASMAKELRGKNLSKYVLVKCADGYEVLFSLAELDSTFTNKVIILADSIGGHPLPESRGPLRVIAPGEKKPARSCFKVTQLIVGDGKG